MQYSATSTSPQQEKANPASALDLIGKIWNILNTEIGLINGAAGFVGEWIGYTFGLVTTAPSIQIGNKAIEFINNPPVEADYACTLGNAINFGTNSEPWKDGAYGDPDVNIGMNEQAHTHLGQVFGKFSGPVYLLTVRYADPLSNPFEPAGQTYGSGRGSW